LSSRAPITAQPHEDFFGVVVDAPPSPMLVALASSSGALDAEVAGSTGTGGGGLVPGSRLSSGIPFGTYDARIRLRGA